MVMSLVLKERLMWSHLKENLYKESLDPQITNNKMRLLSGENHQEAKRWIIIRITPDVHMEFLGVIM